MVIRVDPFCGNKTRIVETYKLYARHLVLIILDRQKRRSLSMAALRPHCEGGALLSASSHPKVLVSTIVGDIGKERRENACICGLLQ